jgi:hypothetical protein
VPIAETDDVVKLLVQGQSTFPDIEMRRQSAGSKLHVCPDIALVRTMVASWKS